MPMLAYVGRQATMSEPKHIMRTAITIERRRPVRSASRPKIQLPERPGEEAERVDARRLHELGSGTAAGEERGREVQRGEGVYIEVEPLDQVA